MLCEGCGQTVDELWQVGEDADGRKIFVGPECIIEPARNRVRLGL